MLLIKCLVSVYKEDNEKVSWPFHWICYLTAFCQNPLAFPSSVFMMTAQKQKISDNLRKRFKLKYHIQSSIQATIYFSKNLQSALVIRSVKVQVRTWVRKRNSVWHSSFSIVINFAICFHIVSVLSYFWQGKAGATRPTVKENAGWYTVLLQKQQNSQYHKTLNNRVGGGRERKQFPPLTHTLTHTSCKKF